MSVSSLKPAPQWRVEISSSYVADESFDYASSWSANLTIAEWLTGWGKEDLIAWLVRNVGGSHGLERSWLVVGTMSDRTLIVADWLTWRIPGSWRYIFMGGILLCAMGRMIRCDMTRVGFAGVLACWISRDRMIYYKDRFDWLIIKRYSMTASVLKVRLKVLSY